MQVYASPEEGNHRYQHHLATALADGLGLDAGLKTAQSNGWEGVLDVLLGKRPAMSTRSGDLDRATKVRTRQPAEPRLDDQQPASSYYRYPSIREKSATLPSVARIRDSSLRRF